MRRRELRQEGRAFRAKEEGPVKINGIAHIVLTVNRPELALPFYERLFGFLELKTVFRRELITFRRSIVTPRR
jgi:hypothetical protein